MCGILFLSVSLSLSFSAESINATSSALDPALDVKFKNPPDDTRPWVYWMWLRVDYSEETITADLEEMHARGIEGVILYDTNMGTLWYSGKKMVFQENKYITVDTDDYKGSYHTTAPFSRLAAWSDRSIELMRFAAKEADRLGIKFCVSIGLAGTSGAITPEYGQQKLVWSECIVQGGQKVDLYLPPPKSDVPAVWSQEIKKPEPTISSPEENKKFQGTEITVLALPHKKTIKTDEVVDLSSFSDRKGRLVWEAPEGEWKIMRFAYVPTLHKNAWGLYVDMMSAEALEKTWDSTIGKLLGKMTPEERKMLYAIEEDSWEAHITTWTKFFPDEFRKQRGYELLSFLPALAGEKFDDDEVTEGVKRDYYRTIADLIAHNHYAKLRLLANEHGLLCYCEACGPNTQQLDYMLNSSGVDVAMGEFWVPSPHRPTPDRRFMLRNAASANHIYGKRVTPCEGFTSVGPHWEDTFFEMKNSADQAFADGCNLQMFHGYSHSPSLTAKPGYVYFAGTHYNRHTTWWEQTPAFNTYLARCSYLLQQGLFVADALYFRGDSLGLGEAKKTRPALPQEGYDHDNCNLDALLTRLDVKDGRLVLPDGMSYRILILPDDSPIRPEALEKISILLEKGAIVVGPKPRGILGYVTPEKKHQAETLIARLWNGNPINSIGNGRLFETTDAAAVLDRIDLPPDFEWKGLSDTGEIDWIHRRGEEGDIYFIASLWDRKERLECTFRVSGKQPEIWNPVTGDIRPATSFRQEQGRTIIPLEFQPRESIFIVFRKPISQTTSGSAKSNYPVFTTWKEISGAWNVFFDPNWGGPGDVVFEELVDWTKRDEENIRHYSGTAIYRKKIRLDDLPENKSVLLDLGELHEVASIKVNGKDTGVVWTKPACIDITDAIVSGENELEIRVVNLWPNRMILDEQLPPEKRLTESNIHKFAKETPLYPSGMIGPVTLQTAFFVD